MQIGPVRSDLQAPGLGGDQGVFVRLSRSQRASGIQLDQVAFEHTFNLSAHARHFFAPFDTRQANGQHQAKPGQHLHIGQRLHAAQRDRDHLGEAGREVSMRAVWYERQGAASEVLQIGELPDPEPGSGEVGCASATRG